MLKFLSVDGEKLIPYFMNKKKMKIYKSVMYFKRRNENSRRRTRHQV